ncbi:MAG: hypothetical protein ACI9LI_000269 [Saprospiraceae bacterium]|jgi:hypothetical protein
MITKTKKSIKYIASTLLLIFIQTLIPYHAFALTSGPAQEEFASFEPVTTTQMVDPYSGDFTYNIPLLNVPGPNGGYPINLAYHGGVGMDQEASWVGLGWSLNVGAINRNLRGLPDDFEGDLVKHTMHTRESWGMGLNLPTIPDDFYNQALGGLGEVEKFGIPFPSYNALNFNPGFSVNAQIYYNNYKGIGYRANIMPKATSFNFSFFQLDLGLSIDSQNGIGVDADLSINLVNKDKKGIAYGLGGSLNSRNGLQSFNISSSINRTRSSLKNAKISSSISFNTAQGVPQVSIPMLNTNMPVEVKIGPMHGFGIFSTYPLTSWRGNYFKSKVAPGQETVSSPAYGFLNSHKNNEVHDKNDDRYTQEDEVEHNLTDFNYTSTDYSKNLPFLPTSTVTHDIYAISGQGTGGMFRPYRSEVGEYTKKEMRSETENDRINLEFGLSAVGDYHIGFGGFDLGSAMGRKTSGEWKTGNFLGLEFYQQEEKDYEPAYFKIYGERTVSFGNTLLDDWGGKTPIRANILKETKSGVINPSGDLEFAKDYRSTGFEEANEEEFIVNSKKLSEREARSTTIQTLTNAQAKEYGMSKNEQFYDLNGNLINKYHQDRVGRDHHITEISTLQPNGMRYIYGLGAYNHSQEEATFSVNKIKHHGDEGTLKVDVPDNGVGYAKAEDYATGNSVASKAPEYINKTELPAYVHSWLLTNVVAPDYVDLTGDGVSDDDYGYWAKFEYVRTTNEDTPQGGYHWRVPIEKANYMPGTNNEFDDMGAYSKGMKELFYLKTIKTKTHVAVFEISEREDGLGTSTDINGGKSTASNDKMYKLDKIKLFTRAEYEVYLNDANTGNDNAIPIKTVNLNQLLNANENPYELCPDIKNSNNGEGKLTLKKLHFTYGKSKKGEASVYKFHYGNNEAYSLKNYDRWGFFKDNEKYGALYPHMEFPYTEQGEDANTAPGLWHLNKIDLPTGGTINIEYEYDDYAYVEDKKAMQMYDIADVGEIGEPQKNKRQNIDNISTNTWDLDALAESNYTNNGEYGYKVYFPLKSSVSTSTSNSWFKEKYLKDVTDIYFKSKIQLSESAISRDFVSGYAEIELTGPGTADGYSYYGLAQSDVANSGEYDLGYITLKPTKIEGLITTPFKVHPFRKAAFQHLRANRPELIYENEQLAANGDNGNTIQVLKNAIGSILPFIDDAAQMIAGGFELYCFTKGYAKEMHLYGHSVIRLLTPDGKKIASSTRVKRVTMTDNWEEGWTSGLNKQAEYGQEYNYTIEENGKIISSGVAYEPNVGKHESALVTPVRYDYSKMLQAKQKLFVERPLMENHYPGASIGYRKVTVKSIAPGNKKAEDNNSEQLKGSAPLTEYEFYTPKDFPIEVLYTDLDKAGPGIELVPIPGFYTAFSKRRAASQGYVLIKNDMPGKLKATRHKTLPTASIPNGVVISETEYIYNVDNNGNLDSEVPIIRSDGSYETGKMGVSYDIVVEMNENKDKQKVVEIDMNLHGGPSSWWIPLPLFPFPAEITKLETSLKTVVVQKIIQQSGILMKTIVRDGQATITSENVAFDEYTGEAILTKINNEFKEEIYAYRQKARWFNEYESMNAAYENIGITYIKDTNGELAYNNAGELSVHPDYPDHLFKVGDELAIHGAAPTSVRAFVTKIINNRKVEILGDNGIITNIPNKSKITIVRSGNKNLLVAEAGGISAMENSNDFTSASGSFTFSKVLNSSAVVFKDKWQTAHDGATPVVNPYIEGIQGIWRPWKTYAYLGERVYDTDKGAEGIRGDGLFKTFTPFDWGATATNPDWQVAGEITKYSPFGFEVENKVFDKQYNQHIYSSALYGYQNSLVTAVASNARYQEIAMDNFEDYYNDLKDGNSNITFETSIGNGNATLSSDESHTGNQSLEVGIKKTASSGQITMLAYNTEDCTTASPYAPECTCLGELALQEGKKYIISAWMKGDENEQYNNAAYSFSLLRVKFFDANGTVLTNTPLATSGKIIDDWQRIWGEVTVPVGATTVEVIFDNSNGSVLAYFDDLRIQPQKSGMTTYAYYRDNLKLAAQMDGNNHATIYIYDEEGKLVKVKKETEEGVKTLQEGRQHTIDNSQ